MVLFDATTLLVLIAPQAAVPSDSSGKTIDYPKERVDGLLEVLKKRNEKIIIPTPALSEVFVRTDLKTSIQHLERMKKSRYLRIEPFCERAAIEVAQMTRKAIGNGDKRSGRDSETWAKIKYDRQIVAIAAVHRAATIYSDDKKLTAFAKDRGFNVVGLGSLPIPDNKAQRDFFKDGQADA
jgi:hypothetical protein